MTASIRQTRDGFYWTFEANGQHLFGMFITLMDAMREIMRLHDVYGGMSRIQISIDFYNSHEEGEK